jgi:RNA polymerase sigma factor (sigma-70 family)
MGENESILLDRFVESGDAAAFSEIVRRHTGLVYGVCLRVLEDKNRAADAVQETFLQLLRDAGRITGPVPNWLHRVATGKAVDVIRSDSSRRRREAEYAANRPRQAAKWEDMSRYIDEAMEELDDETREILIEYFFEGRSMTDVGVTKGMSHPTVSRRIESGVNVLRGKLRNRGIMVAAAALGSLLAQNAAEAAPALVLKELGKIALAGEAAAMSGVGSAATASGAGAKVAFGSVLAAAKTKIIVAVAVVAVGVGGVVIYKNVTQPAEQHQPHSPVSTPPKKEPAWNTEAVSQLQEVTDEADVADESPLPRAESRGAVAEQTMPDRLETPAEDADAEEGDGIDFTSPEATVKSFIKMAVSGDTESVLACYLPGGVDYEDIRRIMSADDPSHPDYEAKSWLQSFDPNVEMPIVRKEQTPYGMKVVWLCTFKKDVTIEGHTFRAGQTMELDATLKKSGDSWLIDNF